MLYEITLGVGMVVLTTIIHAFFMVSSKRVLSWMYPNRAPDPSRTHLAQATLISVLVVWLFLAIFLEALLWALIYLLHPLITEIPDLETALYFSMVTFTSVGYGDVVLTGNWRILASIEGANGVIIFGWTTALIFYFIQRSYERNQ
jgi:hypothetical protein